MTFPLAYNRYNRVLLVPLGLGPRRSRIAVDSTAVSARMGWAFHATFPNEAVREAQEDSEMPFFHWGVTGWSGRWLVNGSSEGLVRIDLDPPQRARVIGWPVKLRQLWIAVEEPAELVRRLQRTGRR